MRIYTYTQSVNTYTYLRQLLHSQRIISRSRIPKDTILTRLHIILMDKQGDQGIVDKKAMYIEV